MQRKAIEKAGLNRFGVMEHAGFDTMIREHLLLNIYC